MGDSFSAYLVGLPLREDPFKQWRLVLEREDGTWQNLPFTRIGKSGRLWLFKTPAVARSERVRLHVDPNGTCPSGDDRKRHPECALVEQPPVQIELKPTDAPAAPGRLLLSQPDVVWAEGNGLFALKNGPLTLAFDGLYYPGRRPPNPGLRAFHVHWDGFGPATQLPLFARVIPGGREREDEWFQVKSPFNQIERTLRVWGDDCEPVRRFVDHRDYRVVIYGLGPGRWVPLAGWQFTAPGPYGLRPAEFRQMTRKQQRWENAAYGKSGERLADLQRADPGYESIFRRVMAQHGNDVLADGIPMQIRPVPIPLAGLEVPSGLSP